MKGVVNMTQTKGLISVRADNTWGVVCTQCHSLIKNIGEDAGDEMLFTYDKCKAINIVYKRYIPKGIQQKDWGKLWESKEVHYMEGHTDLRKEEK